MRELFQTMKDRLARGEELCLVTVVASSGAVPRGAGARMLVGRSGRICGTIGGGAVEFRAIQLAEETIAAHASREQDFSLTAGDVQNLGMICGGAVNVFFHYIPAYDSAVLALADAAEERFLAGTDFWLVCQLGAKSSLRIVTADTAEEELKPLLRRRPQRGCVLGQDLYVEQIGFSGKVYVLGCGHVAQELVPVLSHVGFRCIVMDDREEFARKELFPTAEKVMVVDFNRIGDYITVTENDYVCIMTRGHAYDTVLQAQILRTPACYIGVIGSRHKKAGVERRLREEFGCTEEMLERIVTPIGLSILAETPAEIAISIAGQMIEHRAKRNRA